MCWVQKSRSHQFLCMWQKVIAYIWSFFCPQKSWKKHESGMIGGQNRWPPVIWSILQAGRLLKYPKKILWRFHTKIIRRYCYIREGRWGSEIVKPWKIFFFKKINKPTYLVIKIAWSSKKQLPCPSEHASQSYCPNIEKINNFYYLLLYHTQMKTATNKPLFYSDATYYGESESVFKSKIW